MLLLEMEVSPFLDNIVSCWRPTATLVGEEKIGIDANVTSRVIVFALHEPRTHCEMFIINISKR